MISKLQVLKSNAGYYIGRTMIIEISNTNIPYSRESEYFESKDIAENALKNNTYDKREHP